MNQNLSLAAQVHSCTLCPLGTLRNEKGALSTPALPGKLYEKRGLAILCEAPGAKEEADGLPLVGRAGQLTDELLREAGVSRDHVLLMNTVRCRPPNNNINDQQTAIHNCNVWNIKELEYYDPAVVVLAGNTAMRKLYGAGAKITAVRGKPRATSEEHEYGKRVWLPTFHPAYCLRNPAMRDTLLSDLGLAVELCGCGLAQA